MSVYSPSVYFNQNTDAAFRAWVTEFKNALTAFGWTQTADTGQINLATVTAPSAANQNQGFMIWEMGDALQATNPVFLKLEFGSDSSAANDPTVGISAGTGSNGSGTLTGLVGKRFAVGGFTGSSVTLFPQHFAGDTDRFLSLMQCGLNNNSGLLLFCERLKNADGTDSPNGFVYGISPSSNSCTWDGVTEYGGCQVVETDMLTVPPPWTSQWPIIPAHRLSMSFAPGATPITSHGDDTVFLRPFLPCGFRVHNPSPTVFGYYYQDVNPDMTIEVDVYGVTRTLRPCFRSYNPVGGLALTDTYNRTLEDQIYPMIASY